MAKNTGTLIGAIIKQADSNDAYPVADQADIKGGHHTRATITDRDAIGTHLRQAGMTCYVVANGNTYKLKNDLITWVLQTAAAAGTGGTPLPGSGGASPAISLISGNFGEWTAIGSPTGQFFDVQLPLRYKADLLAFPSRAIIYLQGQFGLSATYVNTTIILGNLPVNTRPAHQLKKYIICKNIELYLVIETNGDVKLISKDGFNLPVADAEATVEDQPYYLDCFFNPVIITEEPQIFTASRSGSFTRNNCSVGSTGTSVNFSQDYTSTVDQPTAEALADASFTADGQAFANDPVNGATCSVPVIADHFDVINHYSKPLQVTTVHSDYPWGINYGYSYTFNDWGYTKFYMNFNIEIETATYWLFNPATYNFNDPDTYQTGLLHSDVDLFVFINLGDVILFSPSQPNIS